VTGGDSGPKLVMKGSPVRVRASAFRDLQDFLLRAWSPPSRSRVQTGTRASGGLSCAPDLVLCQARFGACELFEEMGVGREGHRWRVARLPCDLDDRGSFQEQERHEGVT
jgi:hypothetical protein